MVMLSKQKVKEVHLRCRFCTHYHFNTINREKLHVIHRRCPLCNEFHYNTRNLVVVTTLNPNEPVEECIVQSLSTIRIPFGLNYAPTVMEHLRLFNTARNLYNIDQTRQIQCEDNGMETLELDTPTETVSIPERPPSLETIPSYLRE